MSATTGNEVVCQRHGAVLVVRINRPEARNALNGAVMAGLAAGVAEAEADDGIRVVVLTGTGDRSFCAGMDLKAFSRGSEESIDPDHMATFRRLLDGQVGVPVVGAANASAHGGGLELLLGCDVIVVSAEAKLGLPEVKRGLFPAGGGTAISRRVPLSVALELTLTGDPITPARAFELGLVNSVAPPAEVLATAMALAERIGANAPLGVAACRELVHLAVSDRDRYAARLSHWQGVVFSSEDAKEGAAAFVERREPVWKGC